MDRSSVGTQPPELASYGALLWRRRWIVLLCTLLGLAAAALFTANEPKKYSATAQVLVKTVGIPNTGNAGARTNDNINLDTEAQILRSQPVAKLAQGLLKTTEPIQQLVGRVGVTVPPNTSVLNITCDATSARGAQSCAQAFANAYLTNRGTTAAADVKAKQASLAQQVKTLNTELAVVSGQLGALPATSPDRQLLQGRQTVIVNQLTDLQSQISALSSTNLDPGDITKDALLPAKASWPIVPINLAVGTLAGLLLGIGLAVVRDRLDRRIWATRDVEGELLLPVLAEVGMPRGQSLVVEPSSSAGQAYYGLRNAIMSGGRHPRPHAVLVASPSGPAAAAVAVNLATTLAHSGQRVALVCPVSDSPTIAFLGLHGDAGLADIAQGATTVTDVARRVDGVPGLVVVPPGREPLSVAQLHSRSVADAFATLRDSVDMLIVEAPPLHTGAMSQALAGFVDGVVLVVEARRTTRPEIGDAQRTFEIVAAPVLGAVLVDRTRGRDAKAAPRGVSARPAREELPAARTGSVAVEARAGSRASDDR